VKEGCGTKKQGPSLTKKRQHTQKEWVRETTTKHKFHVNRFTFLSKRTCDTLSNFL
jgi:hypothetical protein